MTKGPLVNILVITTTSTRLYDTFSGSIVGVAVAVLSILLFVAYYPSGEALQAKISSILVAQVEEQ